MDVCTCGGGGGLLEFVGVDAEVFWNRGTRREEVTGVEGGACNRHNGFISRTRARHCSGRVPYVDTAGLGLGFRVS